MRDLSNKDVLCVVLICDFCLKICVVFDVLDKYCFFFNLVIKILIYYFELIFNDVLYFN